MEHKDKIPEEVKADVQKAIDDLKAVMESEDAEDIKEKVQALQVRGITPNTQVPFEPWMPPCFFCLVIMLLPTPPKEVCRDTSATTA